MYVIKISESGEISFKRNLWKRGCINLILTVNCHWFINRFVSIESSANLIDPSVFLQ